MSDSISAMELSARLSSSSPPMLLDVREPEEHELVCLPNSRLIPLGQIPHRVAELADWQGREVVVYCHHGIRSLHAIAFLEQHGFKQLLNLSGGIDAWSRDVDRTAIRY